MPLISARVTLTELIQTKGRGRAEGYGTLSAFIRNRLGLPPPGKNTSSIPELEGGIEADSAVVLLMRLTEQQAVLLRVMRRMMQAMNLPFEREDGFVIDPIPLDSDRPPAPPGDFHKLPEGFSLGRRPDWNAK